MLGHAAQCSSTYMMGHRTKHFGEFLTVAIIIIIIQVQDQEQSLNQE